MENRVGKFFSLLTAAMFLIGVQNAKAFFFQSFETDTFGWSSTTRVMSGTRGVISKVGAFHAEDTRVAPGAFTRWGGYSATFPPGGYTTSVDIYLDISPPYMTASMFPYPNDTRFDWSSAINTPNCTHRRDFVFNAGFYTDTDATGSGPRFVISASNNTGRGNSFPKNPGRMPYTITMEGWYTFEHRFRDNGMGVLAVDLTIKNALGVPLFTWTLSDPSDVIGTTVGGNRYGWFATDEFPHLAFDTSILVGFQDYSCAPLPANTEGKVTGGGQIAGEEPLFSPFGDLISVPALIVSPTDPAAQCTFGFNARCCPTAGNLEYKDHANDVRIKAQSIDTFIISTGPCGLRTHATISGTAKVIRSSGTTTERFTIEVDDCGEPGTGDTFGIRTETYVNGPSVLIGGNIQIHE
jgi:hypothetical protein